MSFLLLLLMFAYGDRKKKKKMVKGRIFTWEKDCFWQLFDHIFSNDNHLRDDQLHSLSWMPLLPLSVSSDYSSLVSTCSYIKMLTLSNHFSLWVFLSNICCSFKTWERERERLWKLKKREGISHCLLATLFFCSSSSSSSSSLFAFSSFTASLEADEIDDEFGVAGGFINKWSADSTFDATDFSAVKFDGGASRIVETEEESFADVCVCGCGWGVSRSKEWGEAVAKSWCWEPNNSINPNEFLSAAAKSPKSQTLCDDG